VGLTPAMGGTQRLAERAGPARARARARGRPVRHGRSQARCTHVPGARPRTRHLRRTLA
jgi:hypothetical protein